MRDILIKAKNLDGPNEWIVGFPQYNWKGKEGFQLEEIKNTIGDIYNVKQETVCQFTGLKDCKSNSIFENDILEISYSEEPPTKWVVCYVKLIGMYRLKMLSGNGERNLFPLNERAIIIGNIKDIN